MLNIYKKIIPFLVYQKVESQHIFVVPVNRLQMVLFCLKKHIGYNFQILSYIAGIDLVGCKYRFSIVYDILSVNFNSRLRVKVFVDEITSVPSIVDLYVNANWWEREVWDMYGVYFENHPDLRRILTDYGFKQTKRIYMAL